MHQFSQEMQQLDQMGQLIRLGYVPQYDLPALISSATVMAYVSHYEGFGMPVAEALASGTAVLTSLETSMEEVADGSATLVEAAKTESIAEGLLTLLEDSELRLKMIQHGLERAKVFNWSASAGKMLQIFDQLQQASKR
jgi:alpha-1,3-rhamnosyl/mannosyltransferase